MTMDMPQRRLILASSSPRRRELLERMGIPFEVEDSGTEETFSGGPRETVLALCRKKAEAVAARHRRESVLVLGADTLVFCDRSLGKPRSLEEARDMLHLLSGRWHEVHTGLCLIDPQRETALCRAECTHVHFVSLSPSRIEAYIATPEPYDKAGGYAIQGMAGMFIDRIEGSPSNVIGLPMSLVWQMLGEIDKSSERVELCPHSPFI